MYAKSKSPFYPFFLIVSNKMEQYVMSYIMTSCITTCVARQNSLPSLSSYIWVKHGDPPRTVLVFSR